MPAGVPSIGDVFAGKYRVDRVLGVGGMGVVLGALHVHLEQRVAIKVLLPEHKQPETIARFLREGRAAAKIGSDHVARVIDVGMLDDGSPYLVMEYLEGSDLAALLEQGGPLPIPLAIDYVLQACEALAEAHACGIVHRDLKPSNLFLTTFSDGSPCVKVLDFGISKALSSAETSRADFKMTKTNTVMGSPIYMSPEQMRSTRQVDARADIWALGTMVYELLSGTPPFVASTMTELCAMIVADPTPLLRLARPEVEPLLEGAITRCLEKDPAKRFQSVLDFATEVAPFGTEGSRASLDRITRMVPGSRPRWDSTSNQRALFASPSSSQQLPVAPSSSPALPPIPALSIRLTPAGHPQAISANEQLTRTSKAWGQSEPPRHHRRAGWIVLGIAAPLLALAVFAVTRITAAPSGPGGAPLSQSPSEVVSPTANVAPTSPAVATEVTSAPQPAVVIATTATTITAASSAPTPSATTSTTTAAPRPPVHPRPPPSQTTSAPTAPTAPRPPSTTLATDRHG